MLYFTEEGRRTRLMAAVSKSTCGDNKRTGLYVKFLRTVGNIDPHEVQLHMRFVSKPAGHVISTSDVDGVFMENFAVLLQHGFSRRSKRYVAAEERLRNLPIFFTVSPERIEFAVQILMETEMVEPDMAYYTASSIAAARKNNPGYQGLLTPEEEAVFAAKICRHGTSLLGLNTAFGIQKKAQVATRIAA